MTTQSVQKQILLYIAFLAIAIGLSTVFSVAEAARSVPGVIANPPPLIPPDSDVRPNLGGNVQSTGTPLTPIDDESGAGSAVENAPTTLVDEYGATTTYNGIPTAPFRSRFWMWGLGVSALVIVLIVLRYISLRKKRTT